MMKSDCCFSDVSTGYGGLLGMPYWICRKCGKPCDVVGEKEEHEKAHEETQEIADNSPK
jgi:hypothetical protein